MIFNLVSKFCNSIHFSVITENYPIYIDQYILSLKKLYVLKQIVNKSIDTVFYDS